MNLEKSVHTEIECDHEAHSSNYFGHRRVTRKGDVLHIQQHVRPKKLLIENFTAP